MTTTARLPAVTQAMDWPIHKILCKLVAGLAAKGLRHKPFPIEVNHVSVKHPAVYMAKEPVLLHPKGAAYRFGGTLILAADHIELIDLPITTALGYPMQMALYPWMGLPEPNIYAGGLRIDPDPKSPDFGKAHDAYVPMGGIALVRSDGMHMPCYHVQAMIHYVSFELGEIHQIEQREGRGELVDREELAARLLSPAAFAAGFERIKQKAIADGQADWEGVECPVLAGQEGVEDNTSKA
ncbi:hypothetical protein LTR17_011449 [Elasticomyces elasticus]|nr:hypothetical protein LTR17_011449 [Elasticomyces elasticus]